MYTLFEIAALIIFLIMLLATLLIAALIAASGDVISKRVMTFLIIFLAGVFLISSNAIIAYLHSLMLK